MNSNLSIPVHIHRVDSVKEEIADFRENIATIAYNRYLNRDATGGDELSDWLAAESEVTLPSTPNARIENNQVVVELVVPEIDPVMLFVDITPHEILILSAPDAKGRRVFQAFHVEQEMDLAGVEAEYVLDTLFIVAAIRDMTGWNGESVRVA